MTRVAILGLGAMGSRVARNLIKAKYTVTVWNRDLAKANPLAAEGAAIARTPRAAVANADFVLSMVRDDDASRSVWLAAETGALPAMLQQSVAIEMSTLSVSWVKELAAEARGHGIEFLDAPVVGSRPQAEARQLIFIAGGDADTLARAEPVLKDLGSAVHHAGPNGAGAALKLAVNALFAVQVAAVAELVALVGEHGVGRERAAEIIGGTPVASAAAKGAMQSMLAGAFAPMFPVRLVEKDLRYAEQLCSAPELSLPMVHAARAAMQQAIKAGYGDDNLTGLFRLYASHAPAKPAVLT
jgi:3-hydroxyisobutyrate dehydrogenase